jgi:hypothetical protein
LLAATVATWLAVTFAVDAALTVLVMLQVFLTIAILMGEGMYMVGRVLLSSKWEAIAQYAC